MKKLKKLIMALVLVAGTMLVGGSPAVAQGSSPGEMCPTNYFQDEKMWEISWGRQFSDTDGTTTFTMASHGGLTSYNGGPVPDYMTDHSDPTPPGTWRWLYINDPVTNSTQTYRFADGTVHQAVVTADENGCPSVAWDEFDSEDLLPTVTKTVDASFVRVHDWDLDKTGQVGDITVDGDSASAEVDYTVTATPGDYRDDHYMLTGEIEVTNGIVESLPFTITDTPDVGTGSTCEVFTADGDPAEDVTIGGEETVTFEYTCELDGTPTDGTNTATVSWFGGEEEVSVTEDVVFSQRDASFDTVTVVDDQATPANGWETLGVADWNAEGTAKVFTYSLAHDDLVTGKCTSITNTAMINQTEQTADETVEICPEAGATPTPTPAPTPPQTEAGTAPAPTLPQTGADVTGGMIAALLLLVTGGAVLALRRRQQS